MLASSTQSFWRRCLIPRVCWGAQPRRCEFGARRTEFVLSGAADGVAYVANRVNQRRFPQLLPEPTNEHLN
jgi:hypothetical protein